MRTVCLLILSLAMSATAHMVWAATPAPSWSLLPQPAEMHPAAKGAVTVSDGDHVLVQAAGDAQALAVVQRFAALVAATRGLHLGVETQADKQSPAAIVFRMDPHADVANDAGYRIAIGEGDIDDGAHVARPVLRRRHGVATVDAGRRPRCTRPSRQRDYRRSSALCMARADAGFGAALPERGRHQEADRLDVAQQIERAALAPHR